MSRRILFLLPLLAAALAVAALAPSRALAQPMDLESAEAELDRLEDLLKSRRSVNEDLLASVTIVGEAYMNLKEPEPPVLQEVPEGASEEEREAIEAANRDAQEDYRKARSAFDRAAPKFRKSAAKLLLKALVLERVLNNTNQRDDVNIRAAQVLAATGDPALAKGIQKALEKDILERDEPPQLLLEEVFAALGKLNNHDSLEWMADEFIHTKQSPTVVVDALVAAHKAMVLFTDVPGRLRHTIVEEMVKLYSSTETTAQQSSADPKVRVVKDFWDRIKTGVIRVVQYYAQEPVNEQGQALATMEEFFDWWRDHKSPRDPVWKDPEPTEE